VDAYQVNHKIQQSKIQNPTIQITMKSSHMQCPFGGRTSRGVCCGNCNTINAIAQLLSLCCN